MINIKEKKELELTVDDVTKILGDYLAREHNLYGKAEFTWFVKNKPISTNWRDSMDHYVFDGVKVTVST